MQVAAKTHWVWTQKAEKINPQRSQAGMVIWPHYAKNAPTDWVQRGLVVDSSDFIVEGQTDLFDLL